MPRSVATLEEPEKIYRGYKYAWPIEVATTKTGPISSLADYRAAKLELKDWTTNEVLRSWSVESGHIEISECITITVLGDETRGLSLGTFALFFSTGFDVGDASDLRFVGVAEVRDHA